MGNDGKNDQVKEEHLRNQESSPYHFGQGLRRLRKERGLSQRGLGRRIGQPRSAIGRWEKQPTPPKWDTIERLATGIGCNATKLLPLGDQAEGGQEIPEATKLLPAREEEITQLNGEVERLKKLILDLVEAAAAAQKDPNTRAEYRRAWMKLRQEAIRIEQDALLSAVESIGAEDE